MQEKNSGLLGTGVFVGHEGGSARQSRVFYSYVLSGTLANNMMQSGSNSWKITGGTGKGKGLKGSGACKAKGNPDGSADFACTGAYTIGKEHPPDAIEGRMSLRPERAPALRTCTNAHIPISGKWPVATVACDFKLLKTKQKKFSSFIFRPKKRCQAPKIA